MADFLRRNLTSITDQDELSCPICFEEFLEPKCLSCLHTICSSCLQNIVDADGERQNGFYIFHSLVRCPICRSATEIPENGVADLPTNRLLIRLKELNEKVEEVQEVEHHLQQGKATLHFLKKCANDIDVAIEMVNKRAREVETDVRRTVELLIAKIKKRENELLEDLETAVYRKQNILKEQKRLVKRVIHHSASNVEEVQGHLNSLSVREIAERKNELLSALREVDFLEFATEPIEDDDIEFSYSEALEARLEEFGVIRSSRNDSYPQPQLRSCSPDYHQEITFEHMIGTEGDESGQLRLPWGVSYLNNGSLAVADHVNNRVQIFDRFGNFLHIFPAINTEQSLSLPTAVITDQENNIVLLDSGNKCIKVFDLEGKVKKAFCREGSGNGELGEHAEGISIDPSGRFIISDTTNDRIQVLHGSGKFSFKFGDRGEQKLYRPSSAVFCNGRFVVSDTFNNCLKIYDKHGLFVRKIGQAGNEVGQFRRPKGLALDPKGNIVVCDSGNCRIQILDSEGNFLTTFGSMGCDDGQFCLPYAVAVQSDQAESDCFRILVSDCNNNRLQLFKCSIEP